MALSLSRRVRAWWAPLTMALFVCVVLEVVTRANTKALPERLVPPPTRIVRALFDEVQTATLWKALEHTAHAWALGLAVGTASAVVAGVVIGSNRWLYRSAVSVVEILRPIPGLAFLPLVILFFGLGLTMEFWLVSWSVFWPILVQTLYGMQDVDAVAQDTARAYGMRRIERLLWIDLPSAAPYIATGFRLSAIIALNVAVGVEILGGSNATGLGGMINAIQQAGYEFPRMYAYVVFTGVVGVLINFGSRTLERRVLRWHPSQRQAVPL